MRASTLCFCWASRCPPDAMLVVLALALARSLQWSLLEVGECAV